MNYFGNENYYGNEKNKFRKTFILKKVQSLLEAPFYKTFDIAFFVIVQFIKFFFHQSIFLMNKLGIRI